MGAGMYDDLKKAFKDFNWDGVKIDNWMFRLHYVASVIIFVAYSGIVTLNTYVGDPIDCIHNRDNEDWGDYLDWFCYIHGTESLKYPKMGATHPTVGVFECVDEKGNEVEGSDCVETHAHYMWVSMVVLIQAGISYLPRYLWHSWEGGRMKKNLDNLIEHPDFLGSGKNDKE